MRERTSSLAPIACSNASRRAVTADRVMTLIAFHLMHNGIRDAVAELLEEAEA